MLEVTMFLASFFGCVIGGVVIYEYSAWRTYQKAKKMGLLKMLPKQGEIRKVIVDEQD